jgi:hypothetical protein
MQPRLFTATERFTVALSVSNLLSGADLLINGSSRARGWGQTAIPDATLLSIQGFDAPTSRFRYLVNPSFGSARGLFLNPPRAVVEVQANIGPNPRRARINFLLRGGRNSATRVGEAELLNRLVGVVPTPIGMATALPNLHLTTHQQESIRAIGSALLSEERTAMAPLAHYLARLPDNYVTSEVEDRITRAYDESADRHAVAVAKVSSLLSAEQIEAIPLYLRAELDPVVTRAKRAREWFY